MATKAFKKLPARAKRAAFASMASDRRASLSVPDQKAKKVAMAKMGLTGAQRANNGLTQVERKAKIVSLAKRGFTASQRSRVMAANTGISGFGPLKRKRRKA